MAVTLLQVLQGLETRLETISGLRAYDLVGAAPNPPCALITVDECDYHATFGGDGSLQDIEMVVHCIAGSSDRASQKRAYAWADPWSATSVRKAIEADATLGGVVHDCIVKSGRVGFVDENGLAYFGARFRVRVLGS